MSPGQMVASNRPVVPTQSQGASHKASETSAQRSRSAILQRDKAELWLGRDVGLRPVGQCRGGPEAVATFRSSKATGVSVLHGETTSRHANDQHAIAPPIARRDLPRLPLPVRVDSDADAVLEAHPQLAITDPDLSDLLVHRAEIGEGCNLTRSGNPAKLALRCDEVDLLLFDLDLLLNIGAVLSPDDQSDTDAGNGELRQSESDEQVQFRLDPGIELR